MIRKKLLYVAQISAVTSVLTDTRAFLATKPEGPSLKAAAVRHCGLQISRGRCEQVGWTQAEGEEEEKERKREREREREG